MVVPVMLLLLVVPVVFTYAADLLVWARRHLTARSKASVEGEPAPSARS
jgi:hypothetical protein